METDPKSAAWISRLSDAIQRLCEGGGAPGLAQKELLAGKSGRAILDAMMSGE